MKEIDLENLHIDMKVLIVCRSSKQYLIERVILILNLKE